MSGGGEGRRGTGRGETRDGEGRDEIGRWRGVSGDLNVQRVEQLLSGGTQHIEVRNGPNKRSCDNLSEHSGSHKSV